MTTATTTYDDDDGDDLLTSALLWKGTGGGPGSSTDGARKGAVNMAPVLVACSLPGGPADCAPLWTN